MVTLRYFKKIMGTIGMGNMLNRCIGNRVKRGPIFKSPLPGRVVVPTVTLAATVPSLNCCNDRRTSLSAVIASSINAQLLNSIQQLPAPSAKVSLTSNTGLGSLRTEFYPDKPLAAVAELIGLSLTARCTMKNAVEVKNCNLGH